MYQVPASFGEGELSREWALRAGLSPISCGSGKPRAWRSSRGADYRSLTTQVLQVRPAVQSHEDAGLADPMER